MDIPINHRVVLLIGPTSSGKTTLSYKLKKTAPVPTKIISQDEVVRSVIDQDTCGMLFSTAIRKKYGTLLREAIKDQEGLIVLDMLDTRKFDVYASIFRIIRNGYFGKITLLKMYLPLDLQLEFCKQRDMFNVPLSNDQLCSNMVYQRKYYESSSGSLCQTFPFTEEYLIKDPREVEFTYPLVSSKQYKK